KQPEVTSRDGQSHKSKQENRKSDYEKQKKHRDLRRRRSRHPRDLREFIPGNAAAPAPAKLHWQAHARRIRLLSGSDPESAGVLCWWHVGSEHRYDDPTTGPAAGSPHNGRLSRRSQLPGVPAHRVDAELAPRRRLHLHLRTSGEGDARYEYDSRNVLLARRIRRQLYPTQLPVADLCRVSQLGRDRDGLRIANPAKPGPHKIS